MTDLDQIRERINLVDFISESVPLKKLGRNFKGLCPFHSERTPSFVVSPERQIWHCFGCGKGGDVFTFLMEMDHLEFPEALKILAEKAGVKLESRGGESPRSKLKERLLTIHQFAQEYYSYILTSHSLGERARLYLKERGVKDQTIKTFGLGFAPASWGNLTRFLKKKGFTNKELELAGLGITGRSGVYDRFRGRVMFPLKNYRGSVIAFSGRLLDVQVKEAKYVNSPETPLYVKGETLYGLEVTKEAIKKQGRAVIVEGEFDVISSFQAGVPYVVAIKGSALTESHVRLLKRFTERVVLALDQDIAGNEAARRGIEVAEQAGVEVRVAAIPSGKDPDEAARENALSWKKAVEDAVPVYDFLITSAFNRHDSKEAFGKKKIADELLPALVRIDNPIVQAHYFKALALRLELHEDRLVEATKKIRRSQVRETTTDQVSSKPKSHQVLLEEHLFTLMIQAEDVKKAMVAIQDKLGTEVFIDAVLARIHSLLSTHAQSASVVVSEFAKTLPSELVPTFDRLYLGEVASFSTPEAYEKELVRTLSALKQQKLRMKIKDLTTDIATAEEKEDKESLRELSQALTEATATLKSLVKSDERQKQATKKV